MVADATSRGSGVTTVDDREFWVIVVVVGALVLLAIAFGIHESQAFAAHCHALGGHVKSVYQYKSSTDYCVTDHGVVDVQ